MYAGMHWFIHWFSQSGVWPLVLMHAFIDLFIQSVSQSLIQSSQSLSVAHLIH